VKTGIFTVMRDVALGYLTPRPMIGQSTNALRNWTLLYVGIAEFSRPHEPTREVEPTFFVSDQI
jgi:hypothetical protein